MRFMLVNNSALSTVTLSGQSKVEILKSKGRAASPDEKSRRPMQTARTAQGLE